MADRGIMDIAAELEAAEGAEHGAEEKPVEQATEQASDEGAAGQGAEDEPETEEEQEVEEESEEGEVEEADDTSGMKPRTAARFRALTERLAAAEAKLAAVVKPADHKPAETEKSAPEELFPGYNDLPETTRAYTDRVIEAAERRLMATLAPKLAPLEQRYQEAQAQAQVAAVTGEFYSTTPDAQAHEAEIMQAIQADPGLQVLCFSSDPQLMASGLRRAWMDVQTNVLAPRQRQQKVARAKQATSKPAVEVAASAVEPVTKDHGGDIMAIYEEEERKAAAG